MSRVGDFEEIILHDLKPYYHVPGAIHSEGITFVKETGTLLWVDIFKGEVHKVEDIEQPESSHSFFPLVEPIMARMRQLSTLPIQMN